MVTKEVFVALRREYSQSELDENNVKTHPIEQFHLWLKNAIEADVSDCTAMILSTCGNKKQPTSRVVLLKEYDECGFVFFTNYESKKGIEIGENPNVALLFFWKELERQVRIEGDAEKISSPQSEIYFHSRPRESQIGALVSKQSAVIDNRSILEQKFFEIEQEYAGKEIPIPVNWGGYIVHPVLMEFWQGRASRLHDRICYKKVDEQWKIERLSP